MPANPRKAPFLFWATLAVPVVLLAALGALFLAYDREPVSTPVQRFLFQGNLPGIGQTDAVLAFDETALLELASSDRRHVAALSGEGRGGQFEFAEIVWPGDTPLTNAVVHCSLMASPRVLAGSISNAATGRFREFELESVASFMQLRRQSGLRFGERGWRMTFTATVPVFDEPTPLDRQAIGWVGELMAARSEEAVRETRPAFREQWNYFWNATGTSDWSEDIIWHVEHRSSSVLSLRADVRSYTGGAHGNLATECHTFWIGDGDPQRVEPADLFQSGVNWRELLSAALIKDLARQGAIAVVKAAPDAPFRIDWDEAPPAMAICAAGLIAYFDPYVAGSHAEGRHRVFVPFTELETALRRDGVIADLRAVQRK